MDGLERIRNALPETAKDIKLNLSAVLQGGPLSPSQRWGVAIASAIAARHADLREAVVGDAVAAGIEVAVIEDAEAAAAIMAMNNIYYRFRHLIGNPVYGEKPARLRMNRLARPATNKADFELFSLAVSAINGCEICLKSHEEAVLSGGLTDEHIHDAVRIAATMHAAAVALEMTPRGIPTTLVTESTVAD